MSTALAFLRRDWLNWTSYRAAVFQQYLGLGMIVILVYVLGTNFSGNLSPDTLVLGTPQGVDVSNRSGDYVAFALIGLALTDLFLSGMSGIPKAIRGAQSSGTMETTLLSPISNRDFFVGSGLFAFVQSLARALLLLGFGHVVLGYWQEPNLWAMLLVLVPGLLCFVALGLLSASFIIVLKQGDPISLGYSAISIVLGGTLFPTNALPEWLQPVVFLLPISHALSGMRLAFEGLPVAVIGAQILILCAFALFLLPLAVWSCGIAMRHARKKGSLGYY